MSVTRRSRARILRWVALAVVVAAAALIAPPSAVAGPATTVALVDVSTSMTASRNIDGIFVNAKDANNSTDTSYTGTVTFSATKGGNPCNACVEVSLTSSPFTPIGNQYTYTGGDAGSKNFSIRWTANAIGTVVLHVSATLQTGGPATTQSNNVVVKSNDATVLDLMNVATSINAGVLDSFNLAMRNANNETGGEYTGTVTFSASCGTCFTVTPNDGGQNTDKYTFGGGDQGAKSLTLTWANSAASPPNRTFTATGSGGLATPSESATVTVGAGPTTTSSTSTSTSSTTLLPSTTTTSTSTTSSTVPPSTPTTSSTSTTSTTTPPSGPARFVTGAGPGGGPHVVGHGADGIARFGLYAYDPNFGGGVPVAFADVTGDGTPDVVTGAGRGAGPHVKAFDGVTKSEIRSFYAFAPTFRGGVSVAAGDLTGDGKADIVVGAGPGGGPHVVIVNGATGDQIASYYAFDSAFSGGVSVAVGDVAGDSTRDVIVGAGAGGGPHVKAFDGTTSDELRSFYAYPADFRGGVYVAAGDVDGDGRRDVLTGAGAGGGPHVKVFRGGPTASELRSFFAFESSFGGGVRVGAVDLDNDSKADMLTGAGPGGNPLVRVFDGATNAIDLDFLAYSTDFLGGVFLGGVNA